MSTPKITPKIRTNYPRHYHNPVRLHLIKYMNDNNISLTQLAQQMKVFTSTANRYVNGTTMPSASLLGHIMTHLNSPDDNKLKLIEDLAQYYKDDTKARKLREQKTKV